MVRVHEDRGMELVRTCRLLALSFDSLQVRRRRKGVGIPTNTRAKYSSESIGSFDVCWVQAKHQNKGSLPQGGVSQSVKSFHHFLKQYTKMYTCRRSVFEDWLGCFNKRWSRTFIDHQLLLVDCDNSFLNHIGKATTIIVVLSPITDSNHGPRHY